MPQTLGMRSKYLNRKYGRSRKDAKTVSFNLDFSQKFRKEKAKTCYILWAKSQAYKARDLQDGSQDRAQDYQQAMFQLQESEGYAAEFVEVEFRDMLRLSPAGRYPENYHPANVMV